MIEEDMTYYDYDDEEMDVTKNIIDVLESVR